MTESKYWTAVGRRKESSAKIKMTLGKGNILVNEKTPAEYFGNEKKASIPASALNAVSLENKFDITAKVSGGGKVGQAEALRHAIARALVVSDESLKPTLRKLGYITRDPRAKERKKPGLKRARKAPQFSKR